MRLLSILFVLVCLVIGVLNARPASAQLGTAAGDPVQWNPAVVVDVPVYAEIAVAKATATAETAIESRKIFNGRVRAWIKTHLHRR